MLRCSSEASLQVLHGRGRLMLSPIRRQKRLRSLIAQEKLRPTVLASYPATFATTTTGSSSPPLSLETFRSQLLETSLTKSVPTYGWTDEAIANAASELQQSSSPVSLASVGLVTVSDLVAYAMDRSNATLRDELNAKEWSDADAIVSNITWALQLRLDLQIDLLRANRWHEGMALGAQPQNVLRTQRQLASMIDSIANAIHPSLTTTERLGLGAVYVAAELHMVAEDTNNTNNFQATRDFLQQRVTEWDRLRRGLHGTMLPSSTTDVLWTVTQVTSAFLTGAQSLVSSSHQIRTTTASNRNNSKGTSPSDYGHPQLRSNIV